VVIQRTPQGEGGYPPITAMAPTVARRGHSRSTDTGASAVPADRWCHWWPHPIRHRLWRGCGIGI